ncbi:MAG: hypothetical protein GXO74_12790 [Calditrichaeota bacterium]|nr:hypothetical protein [Calditrichota bacterium]
MRMWNKLVYESHEQMMFGKSLHPVKCGFGITIGDGTVLPEVNYTVPPMEVSPEKEGRILQEYETIVQGVLSRMVTLQVPGVILEFEHAPQMTTHIEIGARVTEQTKKIMKEYYENHGLKSALRSTICDIREQERPPQIRHGKSVQIVLDSFKENARLGADMLSIESIGGKEINDSALMEGDIPGILFALGVLAPRDMHFLWKNIVEISKEFNVVPAGDTACGFANTAMVLADKNYLPGVLAAVVRAMTAVRSLVAFEEGAVGPSKDCAYEGPVIKAITGFPISMEGKSAACAHFSHVGNIAAAVCDLWSNESVQNVKLLSGFAPEVFSEILAYDCRLMNKALETGVEKEFLKLLVDSDIYQSVHAFIISPQVSFEIAKAIVSGDTDFERTRLAGIRSCELIRKGMEDNKLNIPDRELNWLGMIEDQLALYSTEESIVEYASSKYADKVTLSEYGL